MKLPNRNNAYIPRSKLKEYLLSESHFVGRSKAKFFRKYGFDFANLEILEEALLAIAYNNEVIEKSSSQHGEKYIIDGEMHTPVNRSVSIRTVWIIDKRDNLPRFITAYPIQ